MRVLTIIILGLFLISACGTNTTPTGQAVAPTIKETAEEQLASTDCKEAIQALNNELNNLELERKEAEAELGKKIREVRTTQDEQRLIQLNTEINNLSERVKYIRKGLIPSIQQSILLKEKT